MTLHDLLIITLGIAIALGVISDGRRAIGGK